MNKKETKSKYKYFVPEARQVPEWYKNYNFELLDSMEKLEKVFEEVKPHTYFMGFDTETTGLDFEKLELVGYSFCLDGKTTYYVPVYHFEYEHNLGEPSVEFIYKKMCEAKRVFMFNARYDMRVFEFRGYAEHKEELDKKRWKYVKYDMSKVPYYDVAVPVWLADTNKKLPSLKWASQWFLGYEQMHFDEVIEQAGNFFYLNPTKNPDVVYYAGADALCTYLLASVTLKYMVESRLAGKLDNAVLYPLMHYETEKLYLDGEKLEKMYEEATKEADRLEKEVYDMIGYQINLNSPKQVADAFSRLGIDTGVTTASGAMSTGIKVLEELPQDVVDKYPALKSFREYKRIYKLISSYIKVLLKEYKERGYLRASYKTADAPTGRLAGGKDGKNTYFSPVNIQCVTGDSLVFTNKGLVKMKDLSKDAMVWDGESFQKVLEKFCNGVQDTYRVTLSNGQYLDCTDKHQFYSALDSVGFRELKSLKVGDLVAFNAKGYNIQSDSNNTITTKQREKPLGGIYSKEYSIDLNSPRFWHLVGYFIGDGWYLGKNRASSYGIGIVCNTKESNTIDYIKNTLDSLGISYHVKVVTKKDYTPLYYLTIKSVGISDLFHDLGINNKAENKSIPSLIFSLNLECRKMLLRGLMDSDGKAISSSEWSYCTVSKNLAKDFEHLATSLGINSHIIKVTGGYHILLLGNKAELFNYIGVTSQYKQRNILENGKNTLKNATKGKIHSYLPKCLVNKVISENICLDSAKVSSYTKKNGEKSVYLDKSKINKRFDLYRGKLSDFAFNVHWVKIISIEYLGKNPVYDIHVENTHRYCVNGFITHNSLPKPHVKYYDVYDLGDRTKFSKKENILLGYKFVPSEYDSNGEYIIPKDPQYIGQAEGMNPKLNTRDCVLPKMYADSADDEFIYCTCDYCISPNMMVELESGEKVPLKYLESHIGTKVKTPIGYKKVTDFRWTGKRQKCILKLKSGKEIICSPDHKFYVQEASGEYKWKKLKDIKVKTDAIIEED